MRSVSGNSPSSVGKTRAGKWGRIREDGGKGGGKARTGAYENEYQAISMIKLRPPTKTLVVKFIVLQLNEKRAGVALFQ